MSSQVCLQLSNSVQPLRSPPPPPSPQITLYVTHAVVAARAGTGRDAEPMCTGHFWLTYGAPIKTYIMFTLHAHTFNPVSHNTHNNPICHNTHEYRTEQASLMNSNMTNPTSRQCTHVLVNPSRPRPAASHTHTHTYTHTYIHTYVKCSFAEYIR